MTDIDLTHLAATRRVSAPSWLPGQPTGHRSMADPLTRA